jgi:hypothetical protein
MSLPTIATTFTAPQGVSGQSIALFRAQETALSTNCATIKIKSLCCAGVMHGRLV